MVVMEAAEDKQLKCGAIIRTGPGQYKHSHPGLVPRTKGQTFTKVSKDTLIAHQWRSLQICVLNSGEDNLFKRMFMFIIGKALNVLSKPMRTQVTV